MKVFSLSPWWAAPSMPWPSRGPSVWCSYCWLRFQILLVLTRATRMKNLAYLLFSHQCNLGNPNLPFEALTLSLVSLFAKPAWPVVLIRGIFWAWDNGIKKKVTDMNDFLEDDAAKVGCCGGWRTSLESNRTGLRGLVPALTSCANLGKWRSWSAFLHH